MKPTKVTNFFFKDDNHLEALQETGDVSEKLIRDLQRHYLLIKYHFDSLCGRLPGSSLRNLMIFLFETCLGDNLQKVPTLEVTAYLVGSLENIEQRVFDAWGLERTATFNFVKAFSADEAVAVLHVAQHWADLPFDSRRTHVIELAHYRVIDSVDTLLRDENSY